MLPPVIPNVESASESFMKTVVVSRKFVDMLYVVSVPYFLV